MPDLSCSEKFTKSIFNELNSHFQFAAHQAHKNHLIHGSFTSSLRD